LTGSNFSFNNEAGLGLSDNTRASSFTLLSLADGFTEHVQATNFGFNIPATAIICGIVAEVERSSNGILFTDVTDRVVRLVRNGTISGNNLAKSGSWPSTESYTSYGGTANDWGITWLPAEINASNFGIAIAANIDGLGVAPTAMIDHIRLTVHYMIPPLLSLQKRDVLPTNNTDEAISCYPNPFTNYISITGVPAGQQVRLTDVFGKVFTFKNAIGIDVTNLPPGMYFISTGQFYKKLLKL
jgi:hypothetical protein